MNENEKNIQNIHNYSQHTETQTKLKKFMNSYLYKFVCLLCIFMFDYVVISEFDFAFSFV